MSCHDVLKLSGEKGANQGIAFQVGRLFSQAESHKQFFQCSQGEVNYQQNSQNALLSRKGFSSSFRFAKLYFHLFISLSTRRFASLERSLHSYITHSFFPSNCRHFCSNLADFYCVADGVAGLLSAIKDTGNTGYWQVAARY